LKKYEKCYYTVTKTEDFVIDWSDQNQNILIVSPCSGHGFKFGPIIGNIVADLLVEKSSINVYENFKNEFKIWNHLNHINQ
jgi:sarcosine oxidase